MPPAQPTPSGLPSGSGRTAGSGLGRAISFGRDLMREMRASAAGVRDPREQRLIAEHRMAVVRHETEVRQHRTRMAAWRATMVGSAGSSAVLGVAAASAAAAASPMEAVALGALTLGGAAFSLRARARAKQLGEHPPLPMLPPLPPARLPRGSLGAIEADRVAAALLSLYDMGPNVTRLSPEAGRDLWRAISEVEPLLRAQVERLGTLDRLIHELPGSRAADAAVDSGREITARLRHGAAALEELLVASASMLAAPDLAVSVPASLTPAIQSLEAYAYGLRVAETTHLPSAGLPAPDPGRGRIAPGSQAPGTLPPSDQSPGQLPPG